MKQQKQEIFEPFISRKNEKQEISRFFSFLLPVNIGGEKWRDHQEDGRKRGRCVGNGSVKGLEKKNVREN